MRVSPFKEAAKQIRENKKAGRGKGFKFRGGKKKGAWWQK